MWSLNPDQVNLVSRKLVDWLRYACMQQGASMSSGGFFSGPRTRQVGHVAFLRLPVPAPSSNMLQWYYWVMWYLSELIAVSPSASSTDGGGWGGNGWLLHCAVCGSELHWGPVDEYVLFLYDQELAAHLRHRRNYKHRIR